MLLFFALGLGLRLLNLDLKPAWMDELSTVIFSLGNSSFYLPQDKIVDLPDILRPIVATPEASPWDAARFLLAENNHPPLYFMLAHGWMDLFSWGDEPVSLAIARMFSVFWSALSIPIIFWVTKNTFKSSLAGNISAAFMAVSPFGIFLGQEARHYGLAIVLISLSLGCFAIATRAVLRQETPSWRLCFVWILINALAFSNHYFSALSITAEGLVLGAIASHRVRWNGVSILRKTYWQPIYAVALGSAASILVWLPVLLNFYGSPQTTFLIGSRSLLSWVNPLVQTLAAIGSVLLTPANFYATNAFQVGGIIFSILVVLGLLGWLLPIFFRGGRLLKTSPEGREGLIIMGGFVIAVLGLFAIICYGYGADITRGLRYTFTYYPALVVIVGGIFSVYWSARSPQDPLNATVPLIRKTLSGRQVVQMAWLASLVSALLVVNNLAFPKFYAPDRLVSFVQANSSHPVLFVSTEKIFEEPTVIGAKFLSIAWEIKRHFPPENPESGWQRPPQFLVLKEGYGIETPIAKSFETQIQQLSETRDVWIIRPNGDEKDPLRRSPPKGCRLSPDTPQGNKGSYVYIHMECDPQNL